MNVFHKIPSELIYIILQYAGEVRVLKRKMTRKNMYQILNDDIHPYDENPIINFVFTIVDRPLYTGTTVGYSYYWNFLTVLSCKRNCQIIHYDIPDNILYKLEEIFINDYNEYYLDDDYYLYTIWMDAICYYEDKEDEIKEQNGRLKIIDIRFSVKLKTLLFTNREEDETDNTNYFIQCSESL